jgi:adenylate kinase family enzyme
MKRIVVVGNAGSGKSTLARKLGARLGIPVVHLDELNWNPGWEVVPPQELRVRLQEAISGDAWVTDGNYALLTFDLRLPRADVVIWVERPVTGCIFRVVRRAIGSCFGKDEHLAAGCPERFDRRFWERLRFIWSFDRINRPRIQEALTAYGPAVPVITLRGDSRIAEFLESISGQRSHLDYAELWKGGSADDKRTGA